MEDRTNFSHSIEILEKHEFLGLYKITVGMTISRNKNDHFRALSSVTFNSDIKISSGSKWVFAKINGVWPFYQADDIEIPGKSTCKTNVILLSIMYIFSCDLDNMKSGYYFMIAEF
jgi:hypothetical protein